jgi:hypothetical protein
VLPLLSYLVVHEQRKCDPLVPSSCDAGTTFKLGVLSGAAVATAVDVAFLSTAKKPAVTPGATVSGVTPNLVVGRDGGKLTLSGAF